MLDFDEPSHTYRWKGEVVPSVTQAVVAAGLVDTRWFKPEHCLRGNAVHLAVFYDITKELDESSVHEIVAPYFKAWRLFREQTNFLPVVELCELRQFNPYYVYAGTPDLVGTMNGKSWIIDIKTGECPTARYQTAGYRELPEMCAFSRDIRRASLRLTKYGRYSLITHSDHDSDFSKFLECLTVYRNNIEKEEVK